MRHLRRPSPWPARGTRAARRGVACAVLLTALGTLATCALAEPSGRSDADPVLQLLRDRGLLVPPRPAEGSEIVRQVRDAASDLVLTAMNFLGVPYRAGGDGTDGFDCSGFTRHIFESSLGLVLPRRADDQAHARGLQRIGREELRPGDLVFFNTLRRTFSHVGIYVGDDQFIHAPRPGAQVRIEDMRQAYWQRRFTGARRADATTPAPQEAATATGRRN
jgi:NlpC/P60 family